jgi:very-short-patch-repair endonuclease
MRVAECTICKKSREEWNNKKSKPKVKTCSKDCYLILMRSIQRTPEMRERASNTRKEFLKKNPESHFWHERSNNRSIPCEYFKQELRFRGINFVEEHYPLDDRFFRIDVAFPEHKLGIEINGSQHYQMGSSQLTDYYQKRHDDIVSQGWTLVEVYHRHVWNPNKIEEIVNIIKEVLEGSNLNYYANFEKPRTKKQIEKEKKAELRKECNLEKYEIYKQAIIESDPGKWGWISRVAKSLNISHTHVRRMVNAHFSEFLECLSEG